MQGNLKSIFGFQAAFSFRQPKGTPYETPLFRCPRPTGCGICRRVPARRRRSQMQCRHVQSEGIESTYRCEAPGATIAQAYADFQARRYRYEAPVIDGVREEKIYQDGYLPHTLPKRSLKREGTEPNGCGGFRYYYHITRHNGGVRVESGGDDDCVAGNGTETRYENAAANHHHPQSIRLLTTKRY